MASASAATLPKHARYKAAYNPAGGLFWGLGVEVETYLHFTRPVHVATPVIRSSHFPERYSVAYSATYKPAALAAALDATYPDASGCLPVPFCVNSHGLTAMDIAGNHKTTYEKTPKPNPAFTGKTWFEELQDFDPDFFGKGYEVLFTFDGDSIEFMTQRFYCATADQVVKELQAVKATFLAKLNAFVAKRKLFKRHAASRAPALRWAPNNPPFVVQRTNPSQVAMFNNGTYHINITLPSYTGSAATPGDLPPLLYPSAFIADHRRFIRMIQWLEPLILAVYGSADPLGRREGQFACASQRCAVSRYIGIGTYDTETMPEGKILTADVTTIRGADQPFWWYRRFHETSAYIPLTTIGMDINFRKHHNHGIEIRCLDWFPEQLLPGLFAFFVHLADLSLTRPLAPEAPMSETWNDLVVGIMQEGTAFRVDAATAAALECILGIPLTPGTAGRLFAQIDSALGLVKGECVRRML
jgi:hypothetical protein